METISQLSLPLFAPATFDELIARHHGKDVLSVIVNRRLRRGWQVRTRPFSETRQLIIPQYLYDAPEEIKGCLVEWALLPYRAVRGRKAGLRAKRASLEKKIRGYIESLPMLRPGRRVSIRGGFPVRRPGRCTTCVRYSIRRQCRMVQRETRGSRSLGR